MRRLAATLALALCVTGCGSPALGEPVELLTGVSPFTQAGFCYTNNQVGLLVVDPRYGTAFKYRATGDPVPVMWRPGYTGRRVGTEVAVLDPDGNVVATTGRRYQIEGGSYAGPPDSFVACGYVTPR